MQTVKMVEQAGRQALACKCDVTSEQSVAAMAAEVQKKFGRCDILINCAGIYPQQDFEQMKFEDWRRVLSINLDSVFLVSAAFPGHEAARLGPRRQHGVEHAGQRGHRLRALHVEQGRHRRLHPGAGDASSAPTASPSTRSRRADADARHAGASRGPGSPDMERGIRARRQHQAIRRVEVSDDIVGTVSYSPATSRVRHRTDA